MERKRYRSWMALAKSTQLDVPARKKFAFVVKGLKVLLCSTPRTYLNEPMERSMAVRLDGVVNKRLI